MFGYLDIIIILFYAILILRGGGGFFSAVKLIGFMGFTIDASLLRPHIHTTHKSTVDLSIYLCITVSIHLSIYTYRNLA